MTLIRRESGNYGWESRDKRIPGGRISLSLRTKDRKEAARRARALDFLLERGEVDVLQRLRAGEIHVSEVADAVKREATDDLRGRQTLDLSLGAMVERVMQAKRATRKRGTAAAYRTYTEAMLRTWGYERSIADISSDEMRTWLYEKKERVHSPRGGGRRSSSAAPWSANSQRGALMVAGFLWRLAIRLELEHAERLRVRPRITRNPWKDIETSGQARPRAAFLEPEEWDAVRKASKGQPWAALLGLCCLGGLRMQEALHLRTGIDVDLDAGTVHVQGRKGEYEWFPKHARSDRVIPIGKAMREILEEHVESGFAGERYFIHVVDRDRPVSYTQAMTWVKQSFQAAGLKYGREGDALTAHSLRHTFASLLVREGWSTVLVAKLMGNTSQEVERTYSHLFPTDLSKLIGTLDRLVGA